MPGYNHYPNCTCGWCSGGGGGGHHFRAATAQASLPAAGTRSSWEGDDFCRQTRCPVCGAPVFFVRHNGGCVWFDELGAPWPKHACFFNDLSAIRLRRLLLDRSRNRRKPLFGLVVETVVVDPGKTGRIIVKCSDGTVIDDEFTTSIDLTSYVGSLVVIEETEDGSFQLNRVAGGEANVEVWSFPKLGVVLVYDSRMQAGVDDDSSRFLVWGENRWTTLRDFNIQPLLVALSDDDAFEITCKYLDCMPSLPSLPRPPSLPLNSFRGAAIFAGVRNEKLRSALLAMSEAHAAHEVKIFAGKPNERRFRLPASFTAERIAEWVQTVEAVRAPKSRKTPTPLNGD